jgi:formamidopyrimidine-DNA glycosylase
MPELPEVEMISRSLNSMVAGRTIESAILLRERLAPSISPELFAGTLSSCTINFVNRRGKHILFDLSENKTLIVHLRMSGRFSFLNGESLNPKFTHAIFHLDGEERLVFDDQRHFGLMKIVATDEVFAAKELAKLAPEPFSDDFTPEYLLKVCRSSRRSLKELLLDQTKVCGLGNIYSGEAMFMAGIDPRKPASTISKARALRLHECIQHVLSAAIAHASTRPVDPQNLEGSYFSGLADAGWFVYDRESQPCLSCNSVIFRLKQGGRSTFYCRKCQKR